MMVYDIIITLYQFWYSETVFGLTVRDVYYRILFVVIIAIMAYMTAKIIVMEMMESKKIKKVVKFLRHKKRLIVFRMKMLYNVFIKGEDL